MIVEHAVDVAGDQIVERRRGTAVRHVLQADMPHQLKQLGRQMRGRAVALGGIGDPSGMALRVGDELGHGLGRNLVGIDNQRVWHPPHHGDRHKLQWIEAEMRIEILVDDQRPRRRGQQGVAVRLRLGDRLGADIAASAGAVVDDDGLAPLSRQPVGEDARHHVCGASRGVRHHDPDDPVGEILGAGRERERRASCEQRARQHELNRAT